jgi:hypothetical protein
MGIKVVAVGGGTRRGVIDEKKLTELGEDGWELHMVSDGQPYVAFSPIAYTSSTPNSVNTMNYTPTVYYFKRLK